ncbi:MAG: VWA domain-containing protein [Candidatus Melainabacteria bacterium]|jgi:Ca-activated chloride channel homolog|nr:VWA domain-containing protein [Candidatus Melainabacteria bacterium]
MTFANPWVLSFLLVLPVLFLIYSFGSKQSNLSIALSTQHKSFSSFFDNIGFHMPFFMRLLLLAIVVVTLARPQLGQSITVNKHLGLDIVLAVDTSQSMSALDLKLAGKTTDRLTVLKVILEDFVNRRSGDRLGLLVFGEKAYTQCPLTMDHGAIVDLINHLKIGMVGNSTAIGDAIAVALKRLKDLKAKSRILILMTDGQSNSGSISPQLAAEMAKQLKVKIYTIGIGQDGEVPFLVPTPFGMQKVKQAIPIDEETLIEISEKTGGVYFRGKTTEDLVKIYNHIDKLEKTEIQVKKYNSYRDIYEPFLWTALIFFLVEMLLANTVWFRVS